MNKPTIQLVAFEARGSGTNGLVFIKDPSQRGRYMLVHKCVVITCCAQCGSVAGEPCTSTHGYHVDTHVVRRLAAKCIDYRNSTIEDQIVKPRVKLLSGVKNENLA